MGGFVGYLDRVNLSVVATPVATDLHLSNSQLGFVLSAFLWTYAIAQIPAGLLIDRLGSRLPIIISAVIWAATSFMSATIGSVSALCLARLLLGVSEAPIYPALWRALAQRFEPAYRGRATSCLDIGSKLSFVFGVPILAGVLNYSGWRACFVVTAALSLMYAALFAWIYPRDRPTEAERKALSRLSASLRAMIPTRPILGISIGFAAYTFIFYLLSTWMPRLIELQLGIGSAHASLYTGIPWLVAVVGEILIAGILIDRLVARGFDPIRVRQVVLCVCLLCSLALIGAANTHSTLPLLICLAISATGLATSAPTAVALIGFVTTGRDLGAVGASVNLIANLSGAFAPIMAGLLLDRSGSFEGVAFGAAAVVVVGIVGYAFVLPGLFTRRTHI